MGKQYTSIIRLFNHSDIATNAELNVSRIKKQLNAEFSLSASGFIDLDDHSYNKNDVYEEIERPDFAARLKYHQGVWDSKSILTLLEDNIFNIHGLRPEMKQFHHDTDFDAFLSPYFSPPFNFISRSFINEGRFSELVELMMFEDFLQGQDREDAFTSLRVFFDENIRLLKNVSEITFDESWPRLKHWGSDSCHQLLNNLPPEFYNSRIDLAVALVDFTVRIQHLNKKVLRSVSTQLTRLIDMPEDLAQIITGNHRIYTGVGLRVKSDRGGTNYWWVIWVIIFLVRMLAHC